MLTMVYKDHREFISILSVFLSVHSLIKHGDHTFVTSSVEEHSLPWITCERIVILL